jgi:hypothetical protein
MYTTFPKKNCKFLLQYISLHSYVCFNNDNGIHVETLHSNIMYNMRQFSRKVLKEATLHFMVILSFNATVQLSNYLCDEISQGRIAEQQPPSGSYTICLVLKLLWIQEI